MDIDKEWEKFISKSGYDDDDTSCEDFDINDDLTLSTNFPENEEIISSNLLNELKGDAPKSSNIYISTKTKIAYLNMHIDLKTIFWKIPVIPYAKPVDGVIKKQMKFNSLLIEELEEIQEKLKNDEYYEEYIITHINNPTGRIKFKDTRKISIGLSKKDIMSYRCKKKSAFYNCFVLILRMKIDSIFREFHVKVFNTGKLEIPGVQNEQTFQQILKNVLEILQQFISEPLNYKENTTETVLINSNFNCGFYINREVFYDILKYKYNIQAIFDPCSYPGIQCKFYYNPDIDIQSGCQISEENKHLYADVKKISFMIFRTGSVLIVGRCDENVLIIIYEFLKNILTNEYKNICQKNIKHLDEAEKNLIIELKNKKKKIRKKTITIETNK
jgi:TATA-box binding protein (TBP) (component of TFIID and TFIIIB)